MSLLDFIVLLIVGGVTLTLHDFLLRPKHWS